MLAEQMERNWHRLEMEGPHIERLFYEWMRLWRHLGPSAIPFSFPFASFAGGPQAEDATRTTVLELDYYLSHPGEYMSASYDLMIQKIVMESPGGFSLRGIGEPLRQLRELIKDLWYRNRQERERGDLDIIQQKIRLLTQSSLSPQPVQILAVAVLDDIQELERLIENGKLVRFHFSCSGIRSVENSFGTRVR